MIPPVVVVGGGLAGIATALRLQAADVQVVLVESRRKLGGRATSFVDPRDGATLDNCQHVVMGCCTHLLDLYERLGVAHLIQWHPTIHWANPPGDPDAITPGWCPSPGHFAGSFLRARFLSGGAKRAVAQAMWKIIRLGREGRHQWRGRPFSDFLSGVKQPREAIEKFWDPVVTSACNLPSASVDAFHALLVFQQGFLQDAWSPVMGLASVPLIALYDPAIEMLESGGGSLRLGESVLGLNFDGRRVTGVVTDEGSIDCSSVVCAVPPDRLAKLCSATMTAADTRLTHLGEVAFSPILGVHLFFDQAVLATPHLVLPGRATHWLFDKGVDSDGRHHVHAVVSAAYEWMDLDEPEIVRRVMEDIAWALPGTRGLVPSAARAVKEKRATFACTPGIDAIRPTASRDGIRGGIENLFLAGDWCATGWPATMEGAVRSGDMAAAALLGNEFKACDVPAAPLARLLGL